jgi:hypothetical protein
VFQVISSNVEYQSQHLVLPIRDLYLFVLSKRGRWEASKENDRLLNAVEAADLILSCPLEDYVRSLSEDGNG